MKKQISPKLISSLDDLTITTEYYNSISHSNKKDKRISFLSLSKAFEIAVEYAWKELKIQVMDEGMDPQSPKAAIRDAAKIGLIDDPESWMVFINARNSGVHDYFSISEAEYYKIVCEFISKALKIFKPV